MMAVLRPPLPRSSVVLSRRQTPKPLLPQRMSNVVARRRKMLKNVSVPMRRGVNRSRQKKNKSASVKNTSSKE